MEQRPFPAQPETAWYEKRLRKKRQFKFIVGILLLCAALAFFITQLSR